MSTWWQAGLWIAGFGAGGGVVASLLSDTGGFVRPRRQSFGDETVWRPGFLGTIVIGALAAFASWALYGSAAAATVVGGTAGQAANVSYELTLSALGGALVVGAGGTSWFANVADKKEKAAAARAAVATTSSVVKGNEDVVRGAVRTGVEASFARTGTTSLSPQERKLAVTEAIKAGEESLRLQGVSVDLSNMVPSGSGSAFFPVDGSTRIQDFLNQVYFSIEGHVKPFTYGVDWILVDLTGTQEHELRDMGSVWARKEVSRTSDSRLLREVGIEAGAKLVAERLAD
jgi:hypothetical protein